MPNTPTANLVNSVKIVSSEIMAAIPAKFINHDESFIITNPGRKIVRQLIENLKMSEETSTSERGEHYLITDLRVKLNETLERNKISKNWIFKLRFLIMKVMTRPFPMYIVMLKLRSWIDYQFRVE